MIFYFIPSTLRHWNYCVKISPLFIYIQIYYVFCLENLDHREYTSQRMPIHILVTVMPGVLCASLSVRVQAENKEHTLMEILEIY